MADNLTPIKRCPICQEIMVEGWFSRPICPTTDASCLNTYQGHKSHYYDQSEYIHQIHYRANGYWIVLKTDAQGTQPITVIFTDGKNLPQESICLDYHLHYNESNIEFLKNLLLLT